jgi:ferrous iron transport protein A
MTLDHAPLHQLFWISHLCSTSSNISTTSASTDQEQIRQLEAIGFLPLEQVMVLNKGLLKGDALVIRVGVSTFALRPSEAAMVVVQNQSNDQENA